jgi:hypothetical protein
MNKDVRKELSAKPINKEKYVRDKIRFGSKQTAVKKQKPYMAPSTASQVARKLEDDPVVQRLSKGIEQAMIEMNAKRLFVIQNSMDSEDTKIALEGAKEAGKVINQYQDRTQGKARQTVDIRNTKVEIKLDMSGEAAIKAAEVIEGEEIDDDKETV